MSKIEPGFWVVGEDIIHRAMLSAEEIDINSGMIAGYGALAASDMVISRMPEWTTEKIYVDIEPSGPDSYTVSFYPRGEPGETVTFKAFSYESQRVVTMHERPSADFILDQYLNNEIQKVEPEMQEMLHDLSEDVVASIFIRNGLMVYDASGRPYRNPSTGGLQPRVPSGGIVIGGLFHRGGTIAPTTGLGLNV